MAHRYTKYCRLIVTNAPFDWRNEMEWRIVNIISKKMEVGGNIEPK